MSRAISSLVFVSMLVAGAGTSVSAHPTRDFPACAAYRRTGGPCLDRGASYYYDTLVHLRGQVSAAHASQTALVVRKKPFSSTWRVVDQVHISDTGRMRWEWRPTAEDAEQRRPYEFKFRIAEHGLSNEVEVFVLFGE